MRHADYANMLRPLLPRQAFDPAPGKLWQVGLHGLIIAGCWGAFRSVEPLAYPVLAVIIGHSMACIAFVAHELTHGAILRGRRLVYGLELFMWGINAIAPTLWRRVHNMTHHLYANSQNDPDRRFSTSEGSWTTRLYSLLFYPSRIFKLNPLPLLHFVPYIIRNTVAAFYRDGAKPELVPYKPDFSKRERYQIAFELGVIVLLQVGIYFASGARLGSYLWAGPVPLLVASATIMIYVFTNHFANEPTDGSDPVDSTTTVIVPSFLNMLHSNFSFHTEHHVFPNMNSAYYPAVGALLSTYFPQTYHRVPLRTAWERLLESELLVETEQAVQGAEPIGSQEIPLRSAG